MTLRSFETDTIDLDPSGQKVATATVDDQRKVVTVTYTDYPERMANVTGNCVSFARVGPPSRQRSKDT